MLLAVLVAVLASPRPSTAESLCVVAVQTNGQSDRYPRRSTAAFHLRFPLSRSVDLCRLSLLLARFLAQLAEQKQAWTGSSGSFVSLLKMAAYTPLPTSATGSPTALPNQPQSSQAPSSFRTSRLFAALHARTPAAMHPLIDQLERLLSRPRIARFVAFGAGALVLLALLGLAGVQFPSLAGSSGGWGSGSAGDRARGKWGSSGGLHSWEDVKGNAGLAEPVLEVDTRTGYTMPPEVYPAALNPYVPFRLHGRVFRIGPLRFGRICTAVLRPHPQTEDFSLAPHIAADADTSLVSATASNAPTRPSSHLSAIRNGKRCATRCARSKPGSTKSLAILGSS